jgi:hypothetical protein
MASTTFIPQVTLIESTWLNDVNTSVYTTVPANLATLTASIAAVNAAKANKGANSDITSISGLTTALSIAQGGTGATTATAARTSLSAVGQNGTETLIGSIVGTNTITGTVTPAITSYVAGQTFKFVAAASSTGAVTINLNGLGARNITKSGSTALEFNDILIGAAIQIIYDGTQFQLTSGAGGDIKVGAIYENNQTISTSYTITSGRSAMSVGPITLSSLVTITLPSGARWVVL